MDLLLDIIDWMAQGPWRFLACVVVGLMVSFALHHYVQNPILAWTLIVPTMLSTTVVGWKWTFK